MKDMRREDEE
ncbi:Protein of unknown function [Bacillus cereus]|nr:Protein of unknown function [Bacillus cereus]SCN40037.1 Protein of unknown function [Bacillus wiedmannii]